MSCINFRLYASIAIAVSLGLGHGQAAWAADEIGPGSSAPQTASQPDVLSFEWATARPNADKVRKLLRTKGATVDPGQHDFTPPAEERTEYSHPSFSPLVVLAGVAAIGYLADVAHQIYQDAKHPGVIIDARGKELSIRENPSLPPCKILVLLPRGGVKEFTCRSLGDWSKAFQAAKESIPAVPPK